jgi:hypothetical protein
MSIQENIQGVYGVGRSKAGNYTSRLRVNIHIAQTQKREGQRVTLKSDALASVLAVPYVAICLPVVSGTNREVRNIRTKDLVPHISRFFVRVFNQNEATRPYRFGGAKITKKYLLHRARETGSWATGPSSPTHVAGTSSLTGSMITTSAAPRRRTALRTLMGEKVNM